MDIFISIHHMPSQAEAYIIKYKTSPIFDLNLKRGERAGEWLLHVSPCGIIVTCKVNRKMLISRYKTRGAHSGYKTVWQQLFSSLLLFYESLVVQGRGGILKDLIKRSEARVLKCSAQDEAQIRGC